LHRDGKLHRHAQHDAHGVHLLVWRGWRLLELELHAVERIVPVMFTAALGSEGTQQLAGAYVPDAGFNIPAR
jgi:hypothetical protein